MSEQEALEYLLRGRAENILLELAVLQVLASEKEARIKQGIVGLDSANRAS